MDADSQRGWVREVRTLPDHAGLRAGERYAILTYVAPGGARIAADVRTGMVHRCDRWEDVLDYEAAGIVTAVHRGPDTYGHVDYYAAGV